MKKIYLCLMTVVMACVSVFAQSVTYLTGVGPSTSINTSLGVGSLPGKFDVNGANGMLSYQIPLSLPRGTNQLSPELMLSYISSQSNGLLGVGWQLNGLSVISRVNKTFYHDNMADEVTCTVDDRYSLDGNRLIATNGTSYGADNSTYSTEIVDFSRIVAHGATGQGPDYFTVYASSGLIYEYGNTTDSKVKMGSTCIIAWKLNKVTDRFGNYIIFTYLDTDDEKPISQIDYTGNAVLSIQPFAHIYFGYKTRTDISTTVYAGKEFIQDLLLTEIDIKISSGRFKRYNINYSLVDNRTHLLNVTEESSQGQIINPTIFGWTDQTESLTTATPYQSSVQEHYIHGDYNGDGRTDLVIVPAKSQYSSADIFKLYLANSSGGLVYSFQTNLWDGFQGFMPADFNGDGKCDLVEVMNRDTYDFICFTSTGTGFDQGHYWTMSDNILQRNDEDVSPFPVDYNGDGKFEIFARVGKRYVVYDHGGKLLLQGDAYFGTVPQESFPMTGPNQVFDFNGDGCTDIMALDSRGYGYSIMEFNGTGQTLHYTGEGNEIDGTHAVIAGDFNGDGLSDFITKAGPTGSWYRGLIVKNPATGKNGISLQEVSTLSPFKLVMGTADQKINEADVNGDGLSDLVLVGKGTSTTNPRNRINVALNRGSGYEFSIKEYIPGITFDFEAAGSFSDFDGDGADEFFYGGPSSQKMYSFCSATPCHLINGIEDGFGSLTTVSYLRMCDSRIYKNYYQGATFPLVNVGGTTTPLVYQTQTDNGIGGKDTVTYCYWDARAHMQGKGFLGFQISANLNSTTNIQEYDYYGIDQTFFDSRLTSTRRFYYANETAVDDQSDDSQMDVDSEDFGWERINFGDKRYFLYLGERAYLDGITSSSFISSYIYERASTSSDYAYLKTISIDYYDGHSQTTSFDYGDEKPTDWLICRPTTITQSAVSGGSGTRTYTTRRTYLANTNSPDMDEYNQGDPAYWKFDRDYDSFGNINYAHKETAGLGKTTTEYQYNSNGSNLMKEIAPTGLSISYNYTDYTQKLKTQTDKFGNTVTYNYNSLDQLSSIVPSKGITKTLVSSLITSGGPSYSRYYIQTSGSDGSLTKTWYDKLGRELRVEYTNFGGSTVKADKEYNAKRQLTRYSEPSKTTPSLWNTLQYDEFGRVILKDPNYGPTETTSYSITAVSTVVNGRTYSNQKDAAGNVISHTDPGGRITYQYTGDNLLRSVASPDGSTSTMTYDKNGNRLSLTDPSAGTTNNTWYGTGQVKTTTNARGQLTTYYYQANGLLDYYTSPEGTTDYSYNTDHLVSNISSPNGISRSFTYENGKVKTITESIGGVTNLLTFVYDDKGRLSKKYYNGMTDFEQYNYNSYGYLASIQFNGTTVWQLTATDEYGRDRAATVGTTSTTWTYDSNNMLSQIAAVGVQQYTYDFDVNTGNLQSRANNLQSKNEIFSYDTEGLDRLTFAKGPMKLFTSYTSDKTGNIESKNDAGTKYAYEDSPYAVSSIENFQNISTTDQHIDYFSFEKVKKITEGTKTAEFEYNADGQRIRMVLKNNGTATKTRWYFGGSVEREDIGGTINQYIWIGGDAYTAVAVAKKTGTGAWTVYNIFRDHLGTMTHLKTGSTVSEYSFDAWGRRRDKDDWTYTLSSEPALFADRGFTAHEYLEDFALYNMNGRLYDPVVGRFLSPDPYVQAPTFTQSFNRYSYCLNNPLTLTDPTGNKWDWNWINPLHWFSEGMQWVNDNTEGVRKKMADAGIPDFGFGTTITMSGKVDYNGNYRGQELFNTQNIDRSNAVAVVDQAMNRMREEYGVYSIPGVSIISGVASKVPYAAAVSSTAVVTLPFILTGDKRIDEDAPLYFYHYTNKEGLAGILSTNVIFPSTKGKVYLTKEAFSPAEVFQNLFLSQPTHVGKGDYVISIGLLPHQVANLQYDYRSPFEYIYPGTLKIYPGMIRGAGPNIFGQGIKIEF